MNRNDSSLYPDLAAFSVGGAALVLTPPLGTDLKCGDQLTVYAVVCGRVARPLALDHDVVAAGLPGEDPERCWLFDPEALEAL